MADAAVRATVVRADSNPRLPPRNRAAASVARARPISPLTRLERGHHGGVQHRELPTQEGEELEMLHEDLASDCSGAVLGTGRGLGPEAARCHPRADQPSSHRRDLVSPQRAPVTWRPATC
jgi:hypothetical protein